MSRRVYTDARVVGSCFAHVGVLRAVGSRRKVAECETIVPYGYVDAAHVQAATLAKQKGWELIDVYAAD